MTKARHSPAFYQFLKTIKSRKNIKRKKTAINTPPTRSAAFNTPHIKYLYSLGESSGVSPFFASLSCGGRYHGIPSTFILAKLLPSSSSAKLSLFFFLCIPSFCRVIFFRVLLLHIRSRRQPFHLDH